MNQIPHLVPGAAQGVEQVVGNDIVYRAVDGSGRLVGWVVPAMGQGFADTVELLVGLDARGGDDHRHERAQPEGDARPGRQDLQGRPSWRAQFAGKPAASR